jgi:hypothetical protein
VAHVSETAVEQAAPLPTEVTVHEHADQPEPEITEMQLESRSEVAETIDHESAPVAIEPVDTQPVAVEQETEVHLEPRSAIIEPVDVQPEVLEHDAQIHLEPRPATIEPVHVQSEVAEHKTHAHLEPRPATIEPVDVQPEETPVVIPLKKAQRPTTTKKTTIGLHGAGVDLPRVELVEPGPLPTLSTGKGKKSAAGLCASCFGAKAAEKKKSKKGAIAAPIPAPTEPKKSVAEEKKEEPSPVTEAPPAPLLRNDEPILPGVNIDTFKERNFQKSYEVSCAKKDFRRI